MNIETQIITNPVARALKIVGDRWTILILRDAFLGRHRFSEFREYSKIARGTLTNRLEFLLEQEVLQKVLYSQTPPRYEYKLTTKGLALYPWALMVWEWETHWVNQPNAKLPLVLQHNVDSQHELKPICVCRNCRLEVTYKDVTRVENKSIGIVHTGNVVDSMNTQRRSRGSTVSDADHRLGHIIEIIGDRWSSLIIASVFLGLSRYDDFQHSLGIATNILADRLKQMVDLGVLKRNLYQQSPSRYEYKLTEKGESLYGMTLALRQWVLDYFTPMERPYKLIHKACGHDLDVDVICAVCLSKPQPDKVGFTVIK
ncbi:helix-turn-helix domain-containing protein [Aliiglaciecola sp. 2_MG-2023]|uniref:winged helix-turn-helix transcriptional regulator n=1 Tax=Alteromonadaceae TaxID=72275 RepID=UPI0026E43930|nr:MULTISPECIES: helix-turn-helix domain-containing protein [unclassified Aliiglaciecola]MDO6711594.1 helix-turn-helix domain-containing protein [Aliiglaciecola sp. 2_MG-2023]MDO6752665.1 helix-turn-helix domain-containing protein [Aliiglaciecola sp. 1_MG-2023]